VGARKFGKVFSHKGFFVLDAKHMFGGIVYGDTVSVSSKDQKSHLGDIKDGLVELDQFEEAVFEVFAAIYVDGGADDLGDVLPAVQNRDESGDPEGILALKGDGFFVPYGGFLLATGFVMANDDVSEIRREKVMGVLTPNGFAFEPGEFFVGGV